jgi:hypothetical protein
MIASKEQVLSLLEGLGQTSQEVADSLQKMGIQGYKHHEEMCPISNFLRKQTLGTCVTKEYNIYMIIYVNGEGAIEFNLMPPTPVREFIRMFDYGAFPALHFRP